MTIYNFETANIPIQGLQAHLAGAGIITEEKKVTQAEFAALLMHDLPQAGTLFSLEDIGKPTGIISLPYNQPEKLQVGDKIYVTHELPKNKILPPAQQKDREHTILTVTHTRSNSI